ncbi:MAG TPA: DEAD/DEAH box helicase [Burkholderiaceae bacterium]|nr:DEAD/DEAH box helicase [Burkholderiaceae bacterium]
MLLELFRQHFGRGLIGLDRDTASRGEAVFSAGSVLSVREVAPGRLEGEVEVEDAPGGTVRSSVALSAHGAVSRFASTCTCAVGADCEHGAAVLLAWLRDERERPAARAAAAADDEPDPADEGAGNGFDRLKALEWVRALRELPLPSSAQPKSRSSVRYLLRNAGRRPVLEVWRVRRRPDGGVEPPEPYRGLGELAASPGRNGDGTDARIAWLLSGADAYLNLYPLDGPNAHEVLAWAARAGRLHLDALPEDPDAPGLAPAEPRRASLDWTDAPEGARRLGLRVEPEAEPVYTAVPGWIDREAGTIGEIADPPPPSIVEWLRAAPPIGAGIAEEVALALHAGRRARPALKALVPPMSGDPVRERAAAPRPVLGLFPLRAAGPLRGDAIAVSFAVEYEGRRIEPLRSASLATRDEHGPLLLLCDPAAEQAFLAALRGGVGALSVPGESVEFATPSGNGRGRVGSGWTTVATFGAASIPAARLRVELLPRLEADGWTVVDETEPAVSVLEPDGLSVGLDAAGRGDGAIAGLGWFELQSGIRVGERRIDLAPLIAQAIAAGGWDAWAQGRAPRGTLWLRLSADEVLRVDAARIEPLMRVVVDWAEPGSTDPQAPALRVDAVAAAAIAAGVPGVEAPSSIAALRRLGESFDGVPAVEPPPSFGATLRPYQREGLAWLRFVADSGTGGVLADDMGLGKTVQVLAHLESERAAGRLDRPVLVVAPTSVVFNWREEVRRHAPALRVLTLTGADRAARFDDIDAHDIVLTSYALLPRDRAALAERDWHAVVADEAHVVKNPRTRAAAAIHALRARHRIALTGTPLENHLGELWSVMQFAVPGLLGSEESFRTRFRAPIERRPGSAEAVERLRALERRIRPFLLRRTKSGVLADLPPRTDVVHRVELGAAQRDLYESIRVAMDERVRRALADAGLERSRIVVLDALLKMRQACCDPSLLALPAARRVAASAKLEALLELLEVLVDEGRRVLVFSQFTTMLDRIEAAVDANERLAAVPRSRLDGDTLDRQGAVEAFQQGDAQLFLLSLKAGGVGLNLTAADTVIHYDPWWNPAVESQATDRAHRIGQDKPVFVYKLIAADTIEERILDLQARKAGLSEAVLAGGLAGGELGRDDLLALFEPL